MTIIDVQTPKEILNFSQLKILEHSSQKPFQTFTQASENSRILNIPRSLVICNPIR